MGNNLNRGGKSSPRPDPIVKGATFFGWVVEIVYYTGPVHVSTFKYSKQKTGWEFPADVKVGQAVMRAIQDIQQPVGMKVVIDTISVRPNHDDPADDNRN